jgi:hypothetical protein
MPRSRNRTARFSDFVKIFPMPYSPASELFIKLSGRFFVALSVLFVPMIFLAEARAQSSLENYRARIHEAAIALDSLAGLGEDAAGATRERTRTVALQAFEQIRRSLPASEPVVWQSGEFETDNRWLHEALANHTRSLENISVLNSERAAALSGTAERLRAIEDRLRELETRAANESEREAMKNRLELILRRAEYNEGMRGESALARALNWLAEQLRKMLPRAPRIPSGGSRTLISVVQVVIVVLIVALVAFLAWKLAPLFQNRFKRKSTRAPKARVILGETIEADKSAADLFTEAETLARGGDMRGAIRKAYIALLCELGDRKRLQLAQHKTNRDYLRDAEPRPALYRDMQPLVYDFERHWYGFQPASEIDWQNFHAHCRKTVMSNE